MLTIPLFWTLLLLTLVLAYAARLHLVWGESRMEPAPATVPINIDDILRGYGADL